MSLSELSDGGLSDMGEKEKRFPRRSIQEIGINHNQPDVCLTEVRHIGQASGFRWNIDCESIHEVLIRVAEDPFTPASILAEMAVDEDVEVRLCVAENPSTPAVILELLALDENADVRYIMAENPNIPITILRILTNDENPYVGCRAESTIERIHSQELAWAS